MKKLTKILLAISLLGWVVGFTTNWYYGLGCPIGAMFLGWFLVFKILEKEMELFDDEQNMNLAKADAFSQAGFNRIAAATVQRSAPGVLAHGVSH
jgi:hypothetical protein